MAWQLTLFSSLGLCAALLSLLVAAVAYQYRDQIGGRPFFWLMLALGGWSLAAAVQLGLSTQPAQLFWQRIALAIGGPIPTLWFVFSLRYAGRGDRLTRPVRALLALDPVAFALLVLTNPSHGAILGESSLARVGSQEVVDLSLEAGYYLHITYSYLLVAAGIVVLLTVITRSSSLYSQQTAILALGAVPPFLANIAFSLRLEWGPLPALDLTPFAFAITGVLFALALYRFDLLKRAPIARQQLIEEMGDGLVVLDADGIVVDANDLARRILDPPPTVGEPIEDVDAAESETGDTTLEGGSRRTITATVNGRRRAYDVQTSALTDHQGREVGEVVALRDVTDRTMQQRRVEVAQRVLRHNLRNDVTVIRGWAEHIAETATDGEAAAARRIVETTDDLTELSTKTRRMISVSQYGAVEPTPLDVPDFLAEVVEPFREDYPSVAIECEAPEDVEIALPDGEPLEVALTNLVENAIEHNDAAEPTVAIEVSERDRGIDVSVADNGPGIPPMERTVLEDGSESSLKHGSGVGLWLTYWSVTAIGGDLSFEAREPRGSVVTLAVPDWAETTPDTVAFG